MTSAFPEALPGDSIGAAERLFYGWRLLAVIAIARARR